MWNNNYFTQCLLCILPKLKLFLYPGRQTHLSGDTQIALKHFGWQMGWHSWERFPSFEYPLLHSHLFGAIHSAFSHGGMQIGVHGSFKCDSYPFGQEHTLGAIHDPNIPQLWKPHMGRHKWGSVTFKVYPTKQVHLPGWWQYPLRQPLWHMGSHLLSRLLE